MTEDACALCGGELVEETLSDEQEAKIRNRNPHVADDDALHAQVCQSCGHISFHKTD